MAAKTAAAQSAVNFAVMNKGQLGVYMDMADIVMESAMAEDDFDFKTMVGIGLMNSHMYRTKCLAAMNKAGLDAKAKFMVVLLCTAIKSKDRIVTTLKARADLKEKSWYDNVLKFFSSFTAQYVANAGDKMPVVKIPESFPPMAALAYLLMNPQTTVDDLVKNLWAAQLALSESLMAINKEWERNFWTNVVKKSKNTARSEDVKLEFNEEFYLTKASDEYPLMNFDGTAFDSKPYSREVVERWIKYNNDLRFPPTVPIAIKAAVKKAVPEVEEPASETE